MYAPLNCPQSFCLIKQDDENKAQQAIFARKVYVLATHGIFSGTCSLILQEAGNLEKVRHVLILPTRHCYAIVADCGDQLPSSKRKCGSNGLQDRGHRHLRWDILYSSNLQYLI